MQTKTKLQHFHHSINKSKKKMVKKTKFNQRELTDHDLNHNYDNADVDNNEIQDEEGIREGGGSSVGGSRWNPTKEQIEMLEKMYSHEGVRTPNAEQIQNITARLKVYGHIEGKNVFYWFQNHKARQRQKQRQERLANANARANCLHNCSINRFIGHPTSQLQHHYYNSSNNASINLNSNPTFPAHHTFPAGYHNLPNPNVICSPYYNLPQPSNMSIPYSLSAPSIDHRALTKRHCVSNSNNNGRDIMNCRTTSVRTTLDLFPVHPTGILEEKLSGMSSTNNSAANSSGGSGSSSDTTNIFGDDKHQEFFEFLSTGQVSSTQSD